MNLKIKAVIFDCDGTLVDSEELHYLAWRAAFERYGHLLEKAYYIQHFAGAGEAAVVKAAVQLLGHDCSQEIIEEKNRSFEAYQGAGLNGIDSTIDFATRLYEQKERLGLKLAVASGARKIDILRCLEQLKIEHYFDLILSGHDDVAEFQDPEGTNKPKPYVYLKTAKLLGLQPEECIAIEDSRTGVSAAVSAGCFTIAVPNPFTIQNDLSHAHLKISSFANWSVEDFLTKLTPAILPGIYPAVLTPLRSDFSCDHETLARHCFSLVQKGCRGVTLFGTTGEGPSFSLLERLEALDALIAAGFDPKRIILGNGSSNVEDTAALGRALVRHGCMALLASPPSFYKNIQDVGVLAYYRQLIERVAHQDLRLLLYHIPQYSGVPISLNVVKALSKEFPSIVVGIKESEGNLALTQAILQECPAFQVFVGNEKQIIESVHRGGSGSICGLANLYPEWICSLYLEGKRGLLPNPPRLDALFQALQGLPFSAAAKAVMAQREGDHWLSVRPPLLPLDEKQRMALLAALEECGLEKTNACC